MRGLETRNGCCDLWIARVALTITLPRIYYPDTFTESRTSNSPPSHNRVLVCAATLFVLGLLLMGGTYAIEQAFPIIPQNCYFFSGTCGNSLYRPFFAFAAWITAWLIAVPILMIMRLKIVAAVSVSTLSMVTLGTFLVLLSPYSSLAPLLLPLLLPLVIVFFARHMY